MEYELQKIKEELKTKDGEVKILRAILKKNPEKQKLFELENELTEHNEMKEEIMVKNNEIFRAQRTSTIFRKTRGIGVEPPHQKDWLRDICCYFKVNF